MISLFTDLMRLNIPSTRQAYEQDEQSDQDDDDEAIDDDSSAYSENGYNDEEYN